MAFWSPPPIPPVPFSQPPPCGLATSGSNYQPGRPDLIGTFQILEEEGGGNDSLKLTNQGSFPLFGGCSPFCTFLGYWPDSNSETYLLVFLFFFFGGGAAVFTNWVLRLEREGYVAHIGLEEPCIPSLFPVNPAIPAPHPAIQALLPSPAPHPQSLAATRAPPLLPPSLPTLAPLPALYSSNRRPTPAAP